MPHIRKGRRLLNRVDVPTGAIPVNRLESLAALSVVGNLVSSSAPPTVIFATNGSGAGVLAFDDTANQLAWFQSTTVGVLHSSGSTWSVSTIATADVADGAITYAKIQDVSATSRVLGRKTAGAGDTEECTASEVLDFVGSTRGSILYRGNTGWAILTPGTSGHVLTSNGAGADPSYQSSSVPSAATQAEQEAGSSTTVYTSPGRQQYHPSAAKGWVAYDHAAATILASYNVSSVGDNSAGDFSVNWDTDFSSANYAIAVASEHPDVRTILKLAGSVQVRTRNSGGTLTDGLTDVTAWGDQ